jgi:hypothetical protein
MFVSDHVLKSYLLLERRALLQCVHADERLLNDFAAILGQLEALKSDENKDVIDVVKSCATMLSRNTEERRKATLQIVRDTEKRYAMPTLTNKRREAKERWQKEKDARDRLQVEQRVSQLDQSLSLSKADTK